MKNKNIVLKPKRKPVEKLKDLAREITSYDRNNSTDINIFYYFFFKVFLYYFTWIVNGKMFFFFYMNFVTRGCWSYLENTAHYE